MVTSERSRRAAGICYQQLRKAGSGLSDEDRYVTIMTALTILVCEIIILTSEGEDDARSATLTLLKGVAPALRDHYAKETEDDDDTPTIQ